MDTLNQPPSPQPTVEQSPIPLKPSVNSKTLLVAVVVSVVIMIGLITYVLTARTKSMSQLPSISPTLPQPSPTIDPTANWKIYKDTVYGFEIKFPQEWLYVLPTEGLKNNKIKSFDFFVAASQNISNLTPNSVKPLSVQVDIKTDNKKTLRERKTSFLDLFSKNELGINSVTDTSIAQTEAIEIKFQYVIKGPFSEKQYDIKTKTIVVLNNKNYEFNVKVPNDESSESTVKLYDQILSTFKFTQ
jgi:hypothetical protein